jgi:outer membrane receptor protein involved in Fe transport
MTLNPKSPRGTLVVLLALLLVWSLVGAAQTSRGSLTGTITDSTGAVVSNAKVTITNKATGVSRSTTSNDAGIYRFDAIDLGDYRLTVEAPSFSKATVETVSISAARTTSVDASLQAGGGQETVTVEGVAETLQTTDPTRVETISTRKVKDLPIIGQNSLNLLLTIPGVATTDQGGSTNSGIGSVNGARPRSNSFLIDGVENNDISVNGPAFAPTNNDAIQEISIQTSNFSAEFGRAGGAVINQVTKGGTNALHGTAAWVYRTQNFNAASRQERLGGGKSAFLEHLPAFTIGGPVVIPGLYDGRGKTFFFGGGQWDRLNNGSALSAPFRVPTAAGVATLQALATAGCTQAQRYLTFLDGLVAPATNVANISLAIPNATFLVTGSCNGTDRTGMVLETGVVSRAVPSLFHDDNHVVRIDHKVSDKQQVSVRWLYDANGQNNGGTIGISQFADADFRSRTMTGAFTHTYVFSPTVTNEFRFNYGRIALNFPLASSSTLTATLPAITYAGSSGLSGIGASTTFPQGRTANNFQYQDVVTVIRGRHQMRFGVDFLRQIARQTAPANIRGNIAYAVSPSITGFSNFLDDFSGSAGTPVGINYGTPTYRPNLFRQAYFFQDDWKVKDNLTVNLGLRYENFGQPANIFRFPVVTTDPAQFGVPSKVDQDNNNFGPTVGFAWSPRLSGLKWAHGDGKMVVRGGFQVSYDTFFNNLLSNMAAGNPNLVSNVNPTVVINAANPRGLANISGIFASLVPAPLNPLTNASSQFSKNIVNPYTMRFSLGAQRELPGGMIVDLAYVGSLTRKQFRTAQLNPLLPNATNTGTGVRMDTTIGGRVARISTANANYNSLQLQVKRAFKETPVGGITFSSNYTWSKSLDVISEVFATNPNPGTQGSSQRLILTNPKLDYGPSDFDIRHSWVTTALWDLKGPKKGVLGQVFGGWSLAYIIPVQSGSPFDVTNGFDRDWDGGTADRPDIGNPNAPLNTRAIAVLPGVCASGLLNIDNNTCTTANDVHFISWGAQNLGGGLGTRNDPNANTLRRNSVRTPSSWLVHMNVIKTFKVTERWKLEYRAEIFNLLNHENFNYTPQGITVGQTLNGVQTGNVNNFLDYAAGRPAGDLTTNSRTMRMGLKVIF